MRAALRNMLDICLLGTGGMIPLPQRFLTSLYARNEGSAILIDCGEGTQVSIHKQGLRLKPIDVICLTHLHADHVAGLPGLLLSLSNTGRTEPIFIIGPEHTAHIVSNLLCIAPPFPFDLRFIELHGRGKTIPFDGYSIEAFAVNHRVPCYGYSIVVPRKRQFMPDRAEALGIPKQFWKNLQNGETLKIDGKTYRADSVLGPERRGLKLTYCTDSRPTDNIANAAFGADLFICEGMHGDTDIPGEASARSAEKMHMSMDEAAYLAKLAIPKELWLTHFSPAVTDPGAFIPALRDIFPFITPTYDGITKQLAFED